MDGMMRQIRFFFAVGFCGKSDMLPVVDNSVNNHSLSLILFRLMC